MVNPRQSCCRLLLHLGLWPKFFAWDKAGKSKLARIAMMAMTTSNSIRVKPLMEEDTRWPFIAIRSGRVVVVECLQDKRDRRLRFRSHPRQFLQAIKPRFKIFR